ncbi:BTB/POZ domain-containing protein NPY4-like [Canna indica]|uniref:BTB/POZ domain-containing protein NPY4-like n=1 Tax=Canna indica TaxID=4628 RepID=A0AAQ3JPD6_9LILI|nr:BTB/POZ domain-containing protein NPY4-like [Canna indica]
MKFMKLGSKPDFFQSDGKDIRFVATDLAADIIIHVGNIKFHLHKFPLLSRSHRLQKLMTTTTDEKFDEICISDIPGGAAAFEICAKFCYGMTVTLNAHNVTAARCAAEYLEMHETVDKGNLIYKIDVFLRTSILRSWKDSIIVLQTTKSFLPWSEELKLINHCIESIASKASIDASKVEWSFSYSRKKLPSENRLNPHLNGVRKDNSVPKDWWVEDLCELEMDYFKKIILAIKSKGKVCSEVIGEALKSFTYRKLSSLGKECARNVADATKNRFLLETIISLLPSEKGCVSCSFLLKLLKAGSLLHCSGSSNKELVKRIGRQLEDASVPDLLIPSISGENTIYDIDMVLNIVEEFIMQDNNASIGDLQGLSGPALSPGSSKISVAKLVDDYLVEVARDPNLPLSKFIDLAELVPSDSRLVHDELYHAIDTYLKEHPGLSKSERKKLCALMDCKKLSVDACAHVVQNERLPLRLVVQVLYFEQMRVSSTTTCRAESGASYGSSRSAITTNTEDECDGAPSMKDLKPTKSAGEKGCEWRSEGNNSSKSICHEKSSNDKVKGMAMPKKMLGKLLSSKGQAGESSSSYDTSGSPSPNSANCEEPKLTPSRNLRYSV